MKRTQKISAFTQQLLIGGEGEQVDFKRQPDGISADDLVAFANAEFGGHIIAGIDEITENGKQIGVVRGCDVSDGTILQVLNKAFSCLPPVLVEVVIENLEDRPILRFNVPPSKTRPHCTPKGVYCRRDGSRNRPLHPSELLKLFLDSEATAFSQRFAVAAEKISAELTDLETSLAKSIKNMSDEMGWAGYELSDTGSKLDRLLSLANQISRTADDATLRLRAMFMKDKNADPVRAMARQKLVKHLVEKLQSDKSVHAALSAGGTMTFDDDQDFGPEITKEEAEELLQRAVKYVQDKLDLEKFEVQVVSPKDLSEDDLEAYAAIVDAGNEVEGGVKERAKKAFRLGLIRHDGIIVGSAALKNPSPDYKARVFGKAKCKADPSGYKYELGWIHLLPQHRRKGQMSSLMEKLMPFTKGSALFATTRSDNDVMPEIFKHWNFVFTGEEYRSDRKEDQSLRLYLREAEKSSKK